MSQHRNMVSIPVKLGENPGVDKVLDDKSYRVMVFCADSNINTDPQNITFPHQSEIKVNGNEVKANLRGLKNKPGSTRPVDVTSYLRLKNDNRNLVEFTYALTNKVVAAPRSRLRPPRVLADVTSEVLSCHVRLQDNVCPGVGREDQNGQEDSETFGHPGE